MLWQDLPSPTTGTYPILPVKDEYSLLNPIMPEDGSIHGSEDSYFRFTSQADHSSLQGLLRLENQVMDANIYFTVCIVSSNFAHNLCECARDKACITLMVMQRTRKLPPFFSSSKN